MGVLAGLRLDPQQRGAGLLGLEHAQGDAVDEQQVVNGAVAGLHVDLAYRDAGDGAAGCLGSQVRALAVLYDPPGPLKPAVDLQARDSLWPQVGMCLRQGHLAASPRFGRCLTFTTLGPSSSLSDRDGPGVPFDLSSERTGNAVRLRQYNPSRCSAREEVPSGATAAAPAVDYPPASLTAASDMPVASFQTSGPGRLLPQIAIAAADGHSNRQSFVRTALPSSDRCRIPCSSAGVAVPA